MTDTRPKVGIGVLLFNKYNQILLGRRLNSHGSSDYGPPGGHLEFGESFEECAIRELIEEVGVKVQKAEFFAVTNDIFIEEKKHYISIFMQSFLENDQQIVNMEPHKTLEWRWFDQDNLPQNLFLPLQNLLDSGKLAQAKVIKTCVQT